MKLINTVFVSLLVIAGLLTAPVTCMCGASIPHGHSLFQLPFHSHADADHPAPGDAGHDAHERTDHMASVVVLQEDECDDGGERSGIHPDGLKYSALSNATEKQDGAVLQVPPGSSTGQPVAITQPALIPLPGQQSESLLLPSAPVLEGLDHSPEIPPPRLTSNA